MKKPDLVIMAAGMGSRYGGCKQIDPVDAEGHLIIDFSIFDAVRAGFERVVFIIKKEMEGDVREVIGDRVSKYIDVAYAYQTPDLPAGYAYPEGRTKPWGTAHAVSCAAGQVKGSFAAINADDFYGRHAYAQIFDFLTSEHPASTHAMVGYYLKNTLTEHGSVARGVCGVDNGLLTQIDERTRIERRGEGAAYTEDGENWVELSMDTIVSMNMWGFSAGMMEEIVARFPAFLDKNLGKNPLKCEYFLPDVPKALLLEGRAEIRVLPSEDRWYGVTYREDKKSVTDAVSAMKAAGVYPKNLWKD